MRKKVVEYNYSVTMENGNVFNIVSLKPIGVRKLNKLCKEEGSECKDVICTTSTHKYELSDEKFIELATRLD